MLHSVVDTRKLADHGALADMSRTVHLSFSAERGLRVDQRRVHAAHWACPTKKDTEWRLTFLLHIGSKTPMLCWCCRRKVLDDVEHSTRSLHALRDMGITTAIDDFGTGFSSLSYLARLPVDTLKIDRSFIMNLSSGPQGLALVSTIINLGHSLGLKVVAEGVETEDQSRMLALLGCDEIQGYLLSRPVAASVFEARFLRSLGDPQGW